MIISLFQSNDRIIWIYYFPLIYNKLVLSFLRKYNNKSNYRHGGRNMGGFDEYYEKAFVIEVKDSLYYKGLCYSKGIGVERDIQEAKKYDESFKYFGEAFSDIYIEAENGDAVSQKMISCYFLFGDRGVGKDIKKAKKWLILSAANGDLESQLILADSYKYGKIFEKDIDKSIYWFEKATKQGYSEAEV